MKKINRFLLMVLLTLFVNNTFAQIYFDSQRLLSDNSKILGVGLNVGGNLSNMDLGLSGNGIQYGAFVNIKPLRFVNINLDVNKGNLKGEPISLQDLSGFKTASFQTDFTQFSGSLRILPLRFLMWDRMDPFAERFSYFYFGLGYGAISYKTDAAVFSDAEFGSLGKYKSTDGVLVQEVGIDILLSGSGSHKYDYYRQKASNELYLNLNFKYNKVNSDNVDGYNPTVSSNKHNDVFTSYSIGIMYRF